MAEGLYRIWKACLNWFGRAPLRAVIAAVLTITMSVAQADPADWPQFWRERASTETGAILDEAFEQFSNRSTDSNPERYERAIPVLEQLLRSEEPNEDTDAALRLKRGRAWMFLGELYAKVSKREQCLAAEQQGLALIESAVEPDSLELARTLSSVGNTHALLQQYAPAMALQQRSLVIFEKANPPEDLSVARGSRDVAALHRSMQQYTQALPLYQRSLAILEKLKNVERAEIASNLNDLALVHQDLNQNAQALPLYQRSLALYEESADAESSNIVTTLDNIAGLYSETGRYAEALPLYQRSLAIQEKILGPEHADIPGSLNNLALVLSDMGQYAQALPLFKRCLALLEKTPGSELQIATNLDNLALLYGSMGQHLHALPLHQRALAITEQILGSGHATVATGLNNLALMHIALRQYEQALPLLQRSFAILEKTVGAEHPHIAASLHNQATLQQRVGRYAQALPLYERSLALREKTLDPAHPELAQSLGGLATLLYHTGEYAQAISLLYRAEQIAANGDDPRTISEVQNTLRAVHAAQGQATLAIFWGKQAVNTIQKLRAGLAGIDRDFQQSFVHEKRYVYSDLADLLIREGRLPEAQKVMAMLKEEEYFDFVRRDATVDPRATQLPLTGAERVVHERYYAIRQELAQLASEHEALQSKRRAIGLARQEEARVVALSADLAKARSAFDAFVGGLSKLLASDRQHAQSVRALQQQIQTHRTLLGTLGDDKQGVATVQYIAGEQRLHIILTTTSIQLAREVAIERTALNSKIAAFRQTVQSPKLDPRALGREMYELLIAPVRADLEAQGVHTLMLFLDGALRYVPFAALVQDDNDYLIQRYRLTIHTEASRSALAQRPQARWQVAALGVTRGFPEQNFSALHAVKEELDGIVRPDVLPGQIYLDERFNLNNLEASLGSPVLHVASHFRFLPGSDSSFLLLGDGSSLTLHDISTRDLRFDAVDLLTLSACETAVGGGYNENGLEVEGLGVLAQVQGAKAVLATLWSVDDTSTGELMQHFYRLRQAQQLTKAEALRQAQLTLLGADEENAANAAGVAIDMNRGAPLPQAPDKQPDFARSSAAPFSHPFYWAPFILMGNWL